MPEIQVLDEIEVEPQRLAELQALLRVRYLPGARERGLALVGCWIHPPLELEPDAGPSRLLVLWSLADTQTFWVARAKAGADPGVAAFWSEVDGIALGRSRRYLAAAALGPGA